MNDAMYEHPATRANLAALRERGYEIVEPERGFLAEGESGIGRLASEERLLDARFARAARVAARWPASGSRSLPGRRAKRSIRCAS